MYVFPFDTASISDAAKANPSENWSPAYMAGLAIKPLLSVLILKDLLSRTPQRNDLPVFVEMDVQLRKGWESKVDACVESNLICGMSDTGMPPLNLGFFPFQVSAASLDLATKWGETMLVSKERGEQTVLGRMLQDPNAPYAYHTWGFDEFCFAGAFGPQCWGHHSINCALGGERSTGKLECTRRFLMSQEGGNEEGEDVEEVIDIEQPICAVPRFFKGWPVCVFFPDNGSGCGIGSHHFL